MSDSEKLDLIISDMREMKAEIAEVRETLGTEIAEVRDSLRVETTERRKEMAEFRESLKNETAERRKEMAEFRESLKNETAERKKEMAELRNEIRDIKLIIENKVNINIQRIAEGHLDLSRNLKEAIKFNQEFEMLSVRVNLLESDVETIKRKIS